MTEKELDFLNLNNTYGGNQYKFLHPRMNRGGCSTVCACHAAALLAMHDRTKSALYPYDSLTLTETEFKAFAKTMYQYVYPGFRGMPETRLFQEGFEKYAQSVSIKVEFAELQGNESFDSAQQFIRNKIDDGISIQFLLLKHQNEAFSEIEWHWFTITGYTDENILYSTWGERCLASLSELWNTGYPEKGGLIAIY
ncbi:MAG TPA: hypothetical protein VFF80_06005 [Bacillota bacterium]|nr:hypothetical protein [Bacillota bacterium]